MHDSEMQLERDKEKLRSCGELIVRVLTMRANMG